MGLTEESSLTATALVLPLLQRERRKRTDRRRRHRIKLSLPACLRPFDPRYACLEEVQTTLNFNRDGLYFTTWLEQYFLGMRVLVTFPYCSEASARLEYLGKVVRMERLADGRLGVAVQFVF